MTSRYYQLPSLTQLAAFDAAARHLSFKWAASEMNVTPSAISHQIRALETELGQPLFDRSHRRVQLTPAGNELQTSLAEAFRMVSQSVGKLKSQKPDYLVSIAATQAVSALWLTPRLNRFWKQHGEIRVNQIVTDHWDEATNKAEMIICYGLPKTADTEAIELFRDELVPLANPSMKARFGNMKLAGLAQLPLIQLDAQPEWTSWRDWFDHLGYIGDLNLSQRVNNYMIALQSVRDGYGVALGWRHLVQPLIDKGDLIVLTNYTVPAPQAFHLVTPPNSEMTNNARILRRWFAGVD